eukprot:CAMPEP_0172496304 /NCGR_PEP_ID=MMETSP1066-20121228/84979_1 /TAXON_ID=671091 /ORGANISM="Coscinodiscus wailesii, Strain CCMP2513" /LENGTH=224 /DNA_ID=CAMNT_0013268527 /DNA_START=43 /DNA_END=717 /DNA_ORIENTATION=+
MAPSIKLTYFDIEGVAEPIRLALILSGLEFEDDRVVFKDWSALKPTLPYGQLPIMTIDGSEMKTQSGAMLRWAGSQGKLYPSNKLYDIEEAIGLIGDAQKSWGPSLYIAMRPENYGYPQGYNKSDEGIERIKTMRQNWIANELPRYLKYISDMIDKHGGKWIAGEEVTIADCLAAPFLRRFTVGGIDHVDANCLDGYPKIVEYIERFCALDGIKGRYKTGLGSN